MVRTAPAPKRRLSYIDSTRGAAGVLAILAHLSSDQFRFVDYGLLAGTSVFTRMATPMFMTLFGVMIALVYLPRLAGTQAEEDAVVRRLVSRMITCYAIFGAITLAAVVSGKIRPEKAMEAMLFVNAGRFGEILKIYSVLFFVIILTLPWLKRFGLWWLVGMAAFGWALRYALAAVVPPGNYPLQFFTGYDDGFGPALLLSFTFVAFGAAIGQAITGRGGRLLPGVVAAGSALSLVVGAWWLGAYTLIHGVGTYEFRAMNHPLYYTYGMAATSGALLLFAWIWSAGVLKAPAELLATIGKRSLFFYGFGNLALNLLPVYEGSPWVGLLLSAIFLTVLILLTLDLHSEDSRLDRLSGGFLSDFKVRYDAGMHSLLTRMQTNVRGWRA